MATVRSRVIGAFDKMAAQRPELIQTGTIQQPTPTATAPAPVSVRMAVFEVADRRIDGTNIQAGDYQVIVEPTSIEVTLDDLIICDRGTLTIAILGRVAPGGVTALNDLVCRG